jgi:hypothetical protein
MLGSRKRILEKKAGGRATTMTVQLDNILLSKIKSNQLHDKHIHFSTHIVYGISIRCLCGKRFYTKGRNFDFIDIVNMHDIIIEAAKETSPVTCIECLTVVFSIVQDIWRYER